MFYSHSLVSRLRIYAKIWEGLEHTVSAHSVVGIRDRFLLFLLFHFFSADCWWMYTFNTEVLSYITSIYLFLAMVIMNSRKRTYWTTFMTQLFFILKLNFSSGVSTYKALLHWRFHYLLPLIWRLYWMGRWLDQRKFIHFYIFWFINNSYYLFNMTL